MFNTILWDCDGTLLDTELLLFEATKIIFDEINFTLSKEFWINEYLAKNKSAFDLLRPYGLSKAELREIYKKRNRYYVELLKQRVVTIRHVPETLEILFKNYTMGVVSNTSGLILDLILKTNKLQKYFDFVVSSDDVHDLKPSPAPYQFAIETYFLDAHSTLAIEDSYRGIKSAKAAGLYCIAIPNELTLTHDLSQADKILNSPKELPDFLF